MPRPFTLSRLPLLVLLQVLEAEASAPLVSGEQLRDAGQMPRVLVQGTAGGLVATPAAQQRQEMYQKEVEYTGERGAASSGL